jgi:hypothetical protein
MKDYIIIGLVAVIALLILFRKVSGMSPAPSTNCGSKMINKDLKCSDVYPGVYEKDGTITGERKFCCA